MSEPISFVKAAQQFFSEGEHGRKVEIAEFKALTLDDRREIRDMLISEGYDVAELKTA